MGFDKFLNSENEILKRISREIDEESDINFAHASHQAHSSGSRHGHKSSIAKVEKPLKKNNK